METVKHENVGIERCSGCRGLWFDMLEQEELKLLAGSESLDIGDKSIGKEFNAKDVYNCPKCKGVSMIKMVDCEQPHIWYEACSSCHGVFFDAGEFKDYKEESIFDRFKSLLKKPRN